MGPRRLRIAWTVGALRELDVDAVARRPIEPSSGPEGVGRFHGSWRVAGGRSWARERSRRDARRWTSAGGYHSGRTRRPGPVVAWLTAVPIRSDITIMALTRKKATTIALDPEDDRLLTIAARARGVSRSEFIRQQLSLVLEQYRAHPRPRSAGVVRELRERGDEDELFGGGE